MVNELLLDVHAAVLAALGQLRQSLTDFGKHVIAQLDQGETH
ncbi:hypothetical protein ACSBOX_03775 [Arthrobacter sp. KN11-1C]